MAKWTAAIAALALIGAPAAAAPASYSNLFVFGDSLVDSGNAQFARLVAGQEDPAPTSLGYFQGRFSNGYNFADLLSFGINGAPATAFAYGGTNFAVGGAQAAEVVGDPSPSFQEQIGLFDLSGRSFASDSLVLITLGGNDVRAELAKLGTIPGYTPSLSAATTALATGLDALYDRGARNFLVTGLPNIGQIPAVTSIGSAALSTAGTQLSFALNAQFNGVVGAFGAANAANAQFFDLFTYQQTIYSNPSAYGLPALNTEDSCLAESAGPACAGYVYFDTIHPTTALHSAIAQGLANQVGIGAVPEPASWVMLIGGFALIGGGLRRRRARSARAALA